MSITELHTCCHYLCNDFTKIKENKYPRGVAMEINKQYTQILNMTSHYLP